MGVGITQELERCLRKTDQLSRLPGVCCGLGIAFWSTYLTAEYFSFVFVFIMNQINESLVAFWVKGAWR